MSQSRNLLCQLCCVEWSEFHGLSLTVVCVYISLFRFTFLSGQPRPHDRYALVLLNKILHAQPTRSVRQYINEYGEYFNALHEMGSEKK